LVNLGKQQDGAIVALTASNGETSMLSPTASGGAGTLIEDSTPRIAALREGRFQEVGLMLGVALHEPFTSEIANDWGTAELACGKAARAQQGFVQALRLDRMNQEAAANLGALLAHLGWTTEALAFVERAAMGADGARQTSRRPHAIRKQFAKPPVIEYMAWNIFQ
jgi:hypothetical protein